MQRKKEFKLPNKCIEKKPYLAQSRRARREKISAPQRLCGIKNIMDRNFFLVHTAAKMP
jgi:hypothetical protein